MLLFVAFLCCLSCALALGRITNPMCTDGSAEAQGDLQSVVLHDMSVKHVKSTFPVSVGANVFGVDNNTFASSGEAFSWIITPGTDRKYDHSLQKDPVEMAYSFSSKVRCDERGWSSRRLADSPPRRSAVPGLHRLQ